MSVNLYGNIGTTYTGIVTGAELERVSQEIFGGAQVKAPQTAESAKVQTQQTLTHEIDLYNRNTDINLTQQVSQMKAGYAIQLSPEAMMNLQALRTLAATQQTNVHKLSEGKIYVPVDNSEKSDIVTAFAVPHSTNVLSAFSMEKDRKGSNPFSYTQLPSQSKEESAENINGTINSVA